MKSRQFSSWGSKRDEHDAPLLYSKPDLNDTLTTHYTRDNIPKPPKIDETSQKVMGVEDELTTAFKMSATHKLY